MANERPFESVHWETVTEVETAQGRESVRSGVETGPLAPSFIARVRAERRAHKRVLVWMAAGFVLLLAIAALIGLWLSGAALSVAGLVLAGALGTWIIWWARRPGDTHTRMVYFRRYGPFRVTSGGDSDYYLEVTGHKLLIRDANWSAAPDRELKALHAIVSAMEWGEVYHTGWGEILEVRDRDGTVVYQNPRRTGWRDNE